MRLVRLSEGRAVVGRRATRLYLTLIGSALALAGLSLLLPSTPSYDPWAWLGWGREVVHLNLHTAGGPSWKPLPVLFTTVFALFGRAQPDLWLVVARAGALVAVAMAFRLAHRITPAPARTAPRVLAGLIAAASLVNSGGFIVQNSLGYSEGLAVALMLIALDRLLDGAPRQALVVGFLGGLDRPELWFLWVPLGLWLWFRQPSSRRLVVGLFVLTPLLWLLPELWGSGQLFRAVIRAHHPSPGAAAFTRCPLCTVLSHEAWPTLPLQVKLAAVGALIAGGWALWRTRASWARQGRLTPAARMLVWLVFPAGAGLLWWLGIALETQAGFAGTSRYLEPGTALVAIAGGAAWGWLAVITARGLRSLTAAGWNRALAAGAVLAGAALVALPPWIGASVISLPAASRNLAYQARLRSDLASALRRSGGPKALLACGSVMAEDYQVPMLAWALGVPVGRIESPAGRTARPAGPNVIFQDRPVADSPLLPAPTQIQAWEHAGARYTLLAHVRTFSVFSTCPHKVAG